MQENKYTPSLGRFRFRTFHLETGHSQYRNQEQHNTLQLRKSALDSTRRSETNQKQLKTFSRWKAALDSHIDDEIIKTLREIDQEFQTFSEELREQTSASLVADFGIYDTLFPLLSSPSDTIRILVLVVLYHICLLLTVFNRIFVFSSK